MAIGERIRFIRNLRGMTQRGLGILAELPEKTADIRIAQYESGTRVPKEDLTEKIADALNVSPAALNVPDIDSEVGLMHTLFALEDLYGLKIDVMNGEVVLRLRRLRECPGNNELLSDLLEWLNEALLLRDGDISRDDYDLWRYNFKKGDG